MARAPNIDPNIYQVDLVAGLFGAFMMVWISGAQQSDTPVEYIEPPIYATVSISLRAQPSPQAGIGGVYFAIDEPASSQSCLGATALERMGFPPTKAAECDRTPRQLFEGEPRIGALATSFCWQGSVDPNQPKETYKYSYALKWPLQLPSSWSPRGYFYEKRSERGRFPFFEDSNSPYQGLPDDLIKALEPALRALGVVITREANSCNLVAQPLAQTGVYLLQPDDPILSQHQLQLDIAGRDNGMIVSVSNLDETSIRSFDITHWSKINVPWPNSTELELEVCAYKDSSSACFVNSRALQPNDSSVVLSRRN